MFDKGAMLSLNKKRKIEIPTNLNDEDVNSEINDSNLNNLTTDKLNHQLLNTINSSSSSRLSTELDNSLRLPNRKIYLTTCELDNSTLIKPTEFRYNNQKLNDQTDLTNTSTDSSNQTISLLVDYPLNIKLNDKHLLNQLELSNQEQIEKDDDRFVNNNKEDANCQPTVFDYDNQDAMDLNTFNTQESTNLMANQDEYFTNQDDLELLNVNELNQLNQSHSDSSFNFSLINEHSNISNMSTSSRQKDSDFEDLNDSSLNLTRPPNLNQWLDMFHNWTNSERLNALESLVDSEICDIQQIRFLLSIIEPQLQRDFISLLPKEISLLILSLLEPKDILNAAKTCRYWRILCEDNILWREKCRESDLNGEEVLSELFRKRAARNAARNITLTPAVSPVSSPSTSSTNLNTTSNLIFDSTSLSNNFKNENKNSPIAFQRSQYKLAYLSQRAIEHNWKYGYFPKDTDNLNTSNVNSSSNSPKGKLLKEILHLRGHDDHVITCLQFNHRTNIIVSGSDDNTLKVWSSSNGRCLQTLTGHSGGVWSSQLSDDNIVISGSTDRTLKVWDAITGECKHTLYGHTSTVRCMALHGDYVVSGSRDQSLRVWDIKTGLCCHILTGHHGAVRCVQFNGETIVSGAYDFLVKVWDVKTETCLYTLDGHTNRVYSLQFDGINIVSGSLDTSIRVWDAKSGKLKHTLIGHQSLTSRMQLKGSILVSGNADATVKIWNIDTGDCLHTLVGPNKHTSAVTCLQFNSKFVITSSDDGTVKLWELKTGEFIRNLIALPSGGSGGVVWRIRASNTKLVCAIGSRNGTELTAIKLIDFDTDDLYMDNETDNQFTSTYPIDTMQEL